MAGFSVNIGADTSQLTAGLNQATAEVQKFNNALTTAPTQALNVLNSTVQATTAQFDELAASATALARIEAAIDQAAEAATNAGLKFDTLGGRLPLQDFNAFKSSVDRLKTDIATGFIPQIARIPSELTPVVPAANNAANALNKVRPGASQAAAALTNVGRVAQDLPFGFIGIQNNLNPLLETFQRLKAETGSGKAALAALGQSLMGPAGIGIALSVVSSAIVIFQNGIAGFNQKTKEAKDKAEEFAKTLKSVADVIGDATSGQTGGIAQVQALADVVRDTNAAYDQRKRALVELQQINKSYFGDLKLEESQMALLTARVEEYSKAIVAQAVMKGFTDEISRVSVELAKQDRVLKTSETSLNRLRRELENTKQTETSLTGEDRISAKYIKAKKAVDDAEKAFIAQRTVVEDLATNYALLNGSIDGAVKETLKFRDLNDPGKQKAEVDLLKKRLEALEKIKSLTKDATALVGLQEAIFELQVKIAVRDKGKNQISKAELDQQIQGYKTELQKTFENQAIELEAIPKVKFSQVVLADITQKDISSVIAKATGFDKKIPVRTEFEIDVQFFGLKEAQRRQMHRTLLGQLNQTLKSIAENVTVDAFAGIGEKLGEALAGGNVGDVFTSLFDVLAQGLQQFGKALISYGVALLGFRLAVKSLNPIIAIGAGIAAIAAGAAVRASLPKFAQGGIVTGPIVGQIGEMHRPEVIMPLDRLPQMLRSVAGGSSGETQPVLIFTNEGLYFQMKKGERRAGRKF